MEEYDKMRNAGSSLSNADKIVTWPTRPVMCVNRSVASGINTNAKKPPPEIDVSSHSSEYACCNAKTPSSEQKLIIRTVGNGANVVADCVAGSGKTTTVLFLAQHHPGKKILLVTYNSALKMEVRKSKDARCILNLDVHTYHSLCVKYYDLRGHTDERMREVVDLNTRPIRPPPSYDIVVMDEVQDMTFLYYHMIKKFIADRTDTRLEYCAERMWCDRTSDYSERLLDDSTGDYYERLLDDSADDYYERLLDDDCTDDYPATILDDYPATILDDYPATILDDDYPVTILDDHFDLTIDDGSIGHVWTMLDDEGSTGHVGTVLEDGSVATTDHGSVGTFEAGIAHPTLLVLGDRRQAINSYRGSDVRFLTLCRDIWERSFIEATLSTSYRLTDQNASFVNEIMVGESRIRTLKSGPLVTYLIANPFYDVLRIANLIITKMRGGYSPGQVFILAPSTKGKHVRMLEQALVRNAIPCFFQTSDEAEIKDTLTTGKVVFCTFHKSKGRERPLVIVYAFDGSYFEFYAKDETRQACPNVLYVATTRSSRELVVIRSNYKCTKPLPFLHIKRESELKGKAYTQVIEYPSYGMEENQDEVPSPAPVHKCTATDLTSHLTANAASKLGLLCADMFILANPAGRLISLCSNLPSGGDMCEDVSELNGLIIPGLYERLVRRPAVSEIEKIVSNYMKCTTQQDCENHPSLHKLYNETNLEEPTLVDYTRIVVMYYTISQSLDHKIAQIPCHDWLRRDDVSNCHEIMRKHIADDARYEDDIRCASDEFAEYGMVIIHGRIDVVSDDDVYELKCVQALAIEHKLQLLVYMWMWNCNARKPKDHRVPAQSGKRRFFLLNVLSGERWELVASYRRLKDAVELMLESKYGKKAKFSDLAFIEECLHHPTGSKC
jgi:superfamily I DNA/RNA helicase